ncbi:MAG: phage baseplate assembly protein V [Prevotella sp.]
MNRIVILSDSGFKYTDLSSRVKTLTKATITVDFSNGEYPYYGGFLKSNNDLDLLLAFGNDSSLYVEMGFYTPIASLHPVKQKYCRYKLQLVSLNYKKSVTEPGYMAVTMSLSVVIANYNVSRNKLLSKLKEVFGSTYISFLGYSGDINSTMEAKNLVGTVTNYYVHNFTLNYTSQNKEVTLHCYSPDYRMKFDIGSCVFSGRAFATDIFKEVVARHITIDDNSTWKIRSGVSRLNYLSYYNKSTEETCEILQPYLVQYNESSYDFLRRTAQRCGEFFFYDQNEICIGLHPDSLQNTNAVKIDIEQVVINNDEVDVVTGLDNGVSCFSSSYDSEGGTVESGRKFVPAFTDNPYFTQLDAEHGKVIFDMMKDFEIFLYESYTSFVRGTSTESAVMGFVDAFTQDMIEAGIDTNILSGDFKETVDKYCDSVGIDADRSTNEVSAVLLNAFYYYVEKAEMFAEKGIVNVDYLDKTPNLYLAQNVSISDEMADYYIVCEMEGFMDASKDNIVRSNKVKLVPVFKTSTEQNDNGMKSTYIAVPPKSDVEFIRESKPQEGIVTDFKDPMQLGRVRVRFAWQAESEPSSPWIRVAVPYAGDGHGMVMTPDVNDRMMLNFIGGNVECPYVAGYLYCADKRQPTGAGLLKDRMNPTFSRKIISSATGQSITFVDKPDKSSFINMVIPPVAAVWNLVNSFSENSTKPEEVLPFAPFNGELILRDDNGVYELNLSAKTRNITVKSAFGNVVLDAFTGITISAPNGDINIEGKNVNIKAGNNITMVSGSNIRDKERDDVAVLGVGVNSFANFVFGVASKALTTKFSGFKSFKKNIFDISFLRSSWEVLVRPVEGSLKLHSKRNTLITAGKGKALVPVPLMSTAKIGKSDKTIGGMAKDSFYKNEYVMIIDMFKEVDRAINEFNNKVLQVLDLLASTERQAAENMMDYLLFYSSKEARMKYTGSKNDDYDVNVVYEKLIGLFMDLHEIDETLKDFVLDDEEELYLDIQRKFLDAKDQHAKMRKILTNSKLLNEVDLELNKTINAVIDKYQYNINHINMKDVNTLLRVNFDDNDEMRTYLLSKKLYRRDLKLRKKVFWNILKGMPKDKLILLNTPDNPIKTDEELINGTSSDWAKMVDALDVVPAPIDDNKATTQIIGGLIDTFTFGLTSVATDGFSKQAIGGDVWKNIKKTFNISGEAGPRSTWDTAAGGSILLSNSPAVTCKLNKESTGWEPVGNPGFVSLKTYLKEVCGVSSIIKMYETR